MYVCVYIYIDIYISHHGQAGASAYTTKSNSRASRVKFESVHIHTGTIRVGRGAHLT